MDIDKIILKCIWKGRRTRIAKKSFVKEISVYNFKIILMKTPWL